MALRHVKGGGVILSTMSRKFSHFLTTLSLSHSRNLSVYFRHVLDNPTPPVKCVASFMDGPWHQKMETCLRGPWNALKPNDLRINVTLSVNLWQGRSDQSVTLQKPVWRLTLWRNGCFLGGSRCSIVLVASIKGKGFTFWATFAAKSPSVKFACESQNGEFSYSFKINF